MREGKNHEIVKKVPAGLKLSPRSHQGQAEQHCTHDQMLSCLYSTVQLPGASLASVEVSLTFSSSNCLVEGR